MFIRSTVVSECIERCLQASSRFGGGLRFVRYVGVTYKTKTPIISSLCGLPSLRVVFYMILWLFRLVRQKKGGVFVFGSSVFVLYTPHLPSMFSRENRCMSTPLRVWPPTAWLNFKHALGGVQSKVQSSFDNMPGDQARSKSTKEPKLSSRAVCLHVPYASALVSALGTLSLEGKGGTARILPL